MIVKSEKLKIKSRQSGQAILMVVLIMVVLLTVGLSVVSRSITNLRTSKEEADSQRALSAAEAGIEQVLKTNAEVGGGSDVSFGNSTYKTTIIPTSGNSINLNGDKPVQRDDGVDLWLSDYSSTPANNYLNPKTGNLVIYWSTPSVDCSSTSNAAAVEIVLINGPKATPSLSRYVYDPDSGRRVNNKFATTNARITINGRAYCYSSSSAISLSTGGLIARIIPIYADAYIGVIRTCSGACPDTLPSQGVVVESTGKSGGTERKVTVYRGFPKLPNELFTYSLFSP